MPVPMPAPNFLAAAQKILAINAAKRPLNWAPSSPPAVDVTNTGASTINGRTLAQGGIVATASVPDGFSGPLNASSKWIITKPASIQDSTNLTYAPGNSKLFQFAGQAFDFKGSITAGTSFSVRWSTDNGLTWSQSGPYVLTQAAWCKVDFGSVANRIVEVIGEDELFETFGFNFDTGAAAPAAFTDAMLPAGTMFGDSYVFGQGAGTTGIATNQQASRAMARKLAEYIGSLQIRNHGFRTNGFSNDHSADHGGVAQQSKFKDRIDIPAPADHSLSEGLVMGTMDYIVVPGSINDQSSVYNAIRYQDTVDFFTRLRAMQPTALILFPIGAEPPHYSEPAAWANDYANAFKAVFGSTAAAQIANGAYLLDGTRTNGAAWIAHGALGSSIYYPGANNDVDHPNAAGHALFAQLYGDGLLYLAQQIVNAANPSYALREDGSLALREDGSKLVLER